jgi:hypothetical protein
LENLGLNGRILRWILKKGDVRTWIGFMWLRIWTSGGRALENTVINLRVPLRFWEYLSK